MGSVQALPSVAWVELLAVQQLLWEGRLLVDKLEPSWGHLQVPLVLPQAQRLVL
ncbi:hypothetical protein [Pseudomonas sp. ZL2]